LGEGGDNPARKKRGVCTLIKLNIWLLVVEPKRGGSAWGGVLWAVGQKGKPYKEGRKGVVFVLLLKEITMLAEERKNQKSYTSHWKGFATHEMDGEEGGGELSWGEDVFFDS